MILQRMIKACKEISTNCHKGNDIQGENWCVSFIVYAFYSLKDLRKAFEELVQNNDPYSTSLFNDFLMRQIVL